MWLGIHVVGLNSATLQRQGTGFQEISSHLCICALFILIEDMLIVNCLKIFSQTLINHSPVVCGSLPIFYY